MEYFYDGYDTPPEQEEDDGANIPSGRRSRQSSPVSAVEYEFFIEHDTNRSIVLRCIHEEQQDLHKESTASKAVYKANLMKTKKDCARDKAKLEKLETEYQQTQSVKVETEAMLTKLEEEHAAQQEILQCQILNVKLLKDYFLKDKEWKEMIGNGTQQQQQQANNNNKTIDASHFVTNLFIDTAGVTKKEATQVRQRLENIKYLYNRALTSHRKSRDEKTRQNAARMKLEAIEKFNRLNGIIEVE